MLILRIKQAECALADGRLDEAFELAMAADVRTHRRGQDLAGQVARALAGRGRTHLLADRYAEADSDIGKALRLGGNLPEVAELRDALEQLKSDRQHAADREAQVLATARQRVEQGQYSVGAQVLGEMKGPAAEALRTQVDRDRALADAIAERAERAMDDGDWEAALDALAGAPGHLKSRLRDMSRKLVRSLTPQVREAMRSGRLDRAELMLGRLGVFGGDVLELEDQRKALRMCAEALASVEAGRLEAAESAARRLACVLEDAAWAVEAGDRLKQAREAIAAVLAGPLGLVGPVKAEMNEPALAAKNDMGGMHMAQANHGLEARATSAEQPFLLSVDGVGSCLVLMRERVTLGAISSSAACDVRLMADAQLPAVTLQRSDEDYLLTSALPVAINDRLTTNKVLADGDKLALSPRCRMVFRTPSPASATAVLELSSARLPRADVRRIILMDRELIIGPGAHVHVRCGPLEQNIVLVQRGGRLVCQAREAMRVDGRSVSGAAEVGIGTQVEVGPVNLVITKVG